MCRSCDQIWANTESRPCTVDHASHHNVNTERPLESNKTRWHSRFGPGNNHFIEFRLTHLTGRTTTVRYIVAQMHTSTYTDRLANGATNFYSDVEWVFFRTIVAMNFLRVGQKPLLVMLFIDVLRRVRWFDYVNDRGWTNPFGFLHFGCFTFSMFIVLEDAKNIQFLSEWFSQSIGLFVFISYPPLKRTHKRCNSTHTQMMLLSLSHSRFCCCSAIRWRMTIYYVNLRHSE